MLRELTGNSTVGIRKLSAIHSKTDENGSLSFGFCCKSDCDIFTRIILIHVAVAETRRSVLRCPCFSWLGVCIKTTGFAQKVREEGE